jgi:hypothetical protein
MTSSVAILTFVSIFPNTVLFQARQATFNRFNFVWRQTIGLPYTRFAQISFTNLVQLEFEVHTLRNLNGIA